MLLAPLQKDSLTAIEAASPHICDGWPTTAFIPENAYVFISTIGPSDAQNLIWVGINQRNYMHIFDVRRQVCQFLDSISHTVNHLYVVESNDSDDSFVNGLVPVTFPNVSKMPHQQWMADYARIKRTRHIDFAYIKYIEKGNMFWMRFDRDGNVTMYALPQMAHDLEALMYAFSLRSQLGNFLDFNSLPRFPLSWWEKLAYRVLARAERKRASFFDY